MTWMQTRHGMAVDLADPQPESIRLDDLAWALSGICRYNGHTSGHYSVAEHSCYVSDYLASQPRTQHLALAGLMHDASEAYVGDLTYPMQLALGEQARAAVKAMHHRVWLAIGKRLGLLDVPGYADLAIEHVDVKYVDRRILIDERNALLGTSPMPWMSDTWEEEPPPLGIRIHGWPAARANEEFVVRYRRLFAQYRGVEAA